ncbi:DMT family transporter [Brooklawnia cerclae]|uniref:Transporter family-2 protein n=1 Tax=Brooklawnia cerclae TaxID=349934 RepID=A0ABX0SIU6_9ACTN|nr:transporter family-2 protein [Brooklawnia cerclae]
MIAVLLGLTIGVGLPVQTSINTRLRRSVGSPFVASLVSFLVGTVFLIVVTLAGRHSVLFPASLLTEQPTWLWLGGLFGVVYLTGNILLMPRLGAVQTVVMPVFGQVLMSLLIDNFGWFAAATRPLAPLRAAGGLLVLLGVVGVVSPGGRTPARGGDPATTARAPGGDTPGLWLWRLLGVVAGMFSAAQTAVNGHLGAVVGSKLEAAFVSFLVGTLVLIVVVALSRTPLRLTRVADAPHPWWMWLGGIIGAVFVLSNVYLVAEVGTGLAVIIVLIGLMVGSLLIDQFGWFGAKRSPITPIQAVSLLVMIAGAALIRLF